MSAERPVIRATFLEAEEHYLEALARDPKRKARSWIFWVTVLAVLAGLVSPGAVRRHDRGDRLWWLPLAVSLAAVGFFVYWLGPAGQRRRLRKALRKNLTNPPAEAWFEFAEAGFLSTGKGGKSSFHPWSTIPNAVQCSDGVVLYVEENVYYWVPQKALGGPQEYSALLDLIARKAARFKRLT